MVQQPSNSQIHTAVTTVFKKFGFGPFDLEAVIYFALPCFEPTPFTYLILSNAIRNYVVTNFETRRGSLKSSDDLKLHRILVYYRE